MKYKKWRMCGRKKTYYTKSKAEKERKRAEKDFNKPFRVYKCEYGNHWHLTHR